MIKSCWKAIPGILCLLALAACGGNGNDGSEAGGLVLTALHGTSSAGLQLDMQGGRYLVSLDEVEDNGSFFQLELPAGLAPALISWRDTAGQPVDDSLLVLTNYADGVLTAGAVRTGNADNTEFIMELELSADAAPRLASAVGEEIREESVDIAIMDHDPISGSLLLSWPAWTPGDYDLSGLVGIQDITPLGQNYGTDSGNPGQPWPQEHRMHWVDGNADGTLNAADLSVIGQHFNDELLGFRVYYDGQLHQGWDENVLNLLQGDPQGDGLPRRHFLHLPDIQSPDLLELRAVLLRHGFSSGGSNPDLEVQLTIDGIEIIDNGDGLKAGTRVIKPIEDVNGSREIIATPEREDSELASFKGIPRGQEYLLDIVYQPLDSPFGPETPDLPGIQGNEGLIVTSVPFRLPELHGRSTMSIDIDYILQPDGSYFAELNARTDHGNGVQEYSTLLDYAGGILRRDSNNDGSYNGELGFSDSDRDCISDQLLNEINGTGGNSEGSAIHGVMDGPLLSIDYEQSSITFAEDSVQFWSDGVIREDRTVYFSENALFIGFSDIHSLQPGEFVHVEMLRFEASAGILPVKSWAEIIHTLDSNFGEYWIMAEQLENSELTAVSSGRGAGPLDDSYQFYMYTVRSETTGDYFEYPLNDVGTGFFYVPLWPDHTYTISLIGMDAEGGAPILLADIVVYVDPELFWDDFGGPPAGGGGGPGGGGSPIGGPQ